jgi:O-antigen/teichoic acid export membrane protein
VNVKAAGPVQEKKPTLTTQAFWLMAARFIGYVFSFALPLVLARTFTQQEFGLYKQAFLVVMTISVILPLNYAMSAFYFLPRASVQRSIVLNILLAYAVTATAGFAAVALFPGLLQLLLGDTSLTASSGLLAAVVFLWTFSALAESLATANQDVRYSTQFIIGAQVTKTILLAAAALSFETVEAVLWAAVVQGLIQSSVLLWYCWKRFPGWWRSFDKQLFREQTAYVLPFGFGAMLWKLQMDLHGFLVANRFSDAEFALYAVGISQLPLVALFRESINSVLLARMSSLQKSGDRDQMVRLFFITMRKIAIGYLPAFAILMVLGRELIVLMYTRAYEAAWPIFAVNLLTLLMSVISVDAILRAYAETKFYLVKLRIALIIILVFVSLLAINYFGMIGAICALVFTLTIERVMLTRAVVRILGIQWRDWKAAAPVLRIAIATVIAATGAALIRTVVLPYGPLLTVLAAGAGFAAIYVAAIMSAGILDDSEQAIIGRFTGRILQSGAKAGGA